MNQLSSIKALVFDLDGTLLNAQKIISERNQKALMRSYQSGFKLFIATARPPRSVHTMVSKELLDCVSAIYYNGAYVRDANGKTMSFTISRADSEELIDLMCVHNETDSISIESEDILYALSDKTFAKNAKHMVLPPTIVTPPELKKLLANKILLFHCSSIVKRHIMNDKKRLSIVETDGKELMQIMAQNVSKSHAVAALCKKMNLSMDSVMSFGDDWNDLDLFKTCGYSVAMGNAVPDLKKYASMTTASNDEDGVAQIVEQLIEAQ
ncbi:HAD family hydrolase [Sporolactobacillus shoreicorticis]|uniref:HAD family hydrolase n=1 Tax=Sporolactobacillus shoreicorticis TaxID=1923877 RepID=A0ABW5S3P3_9BACL|nr:HAD family hydrolase [Sporolactobacillus shoreicorticis]MCO7126449.1 HAD family hydrolase [Sporolactobacillus shoreicorticis]